MSAGRSTADLLPTEVVLFILTLLDPPSLARCQQVCKRWEVFANEEKVWRRVCIQRAYVSEGALLRYDGELSRQLASAVEAHSPSSSFNLLQPLPEDTATLINSRYRSDVHDHTAFDRGNSLRRLDSMHYFEGVKTYQELCAKKWCLDRAWQCSVDAGATGMNLETGETFRIPPSIKPAKRSLEAAPPFVVQGDNNEEGIEEVGRDVWRIQIDPRGLLISTGQRGGIRVVDIQNGQVLWRLDRRATRNFVHIEYDRGYLLFDRIGNEMEVWKLQDVCEVESPLRGSFVHAFSLFSPRPTRALRFQYPCLALATRDSHILLWDIERRVITDDFSLEGSLHSDANINYIDFDDNFVFLVGTGAKCVSVLSRKLGKIIWTLEEHLESDLSTPETYTLVKESDYLPAKYASLERRRLQRASDSPWQRAISRQNWAQRLMLPVQAWSAIHPDFRSRTLVILGQTNVLLIRDYLTCFLAWERKKEQEENDSSNASGEEARLLSPAMFVDLRFSEGDEGDAELSWDEMPPSQLAVSESRAMCIAGKPMLLDLDPLRLSRSDVREIGAPRRRDGSHEGEIVSDEEAGFAVYNTVKSSFIDFDTSDPYLSSLDACSSVMMDATICCAVQIHEASDRNPFGGNLAMTDYFDVLVWDFSKIAAQSW